MIRKENKSVSDFELRNTIDELTGLSNFANFITMAQHVLNDPTERKDVAFVYFNLENFRSYNEIYGLAAGNDCLRTVATTIEAFFPQELCGRIASDHFGVLTDKANLEEKIACVCEELLPFRMDTHLQMRAGIYLPKDTDFDAHICLNRAKVACDSIRNKYDTMYGYYDESVDDDYQRERYIIEKLDSALEHGYIRPYYQAVIRVLTGEISGYEALARWVDPEVGRISPGDFVPILEKYQLVRKLDLSIIDTVCKDLREKMDAGIAVVPVSVNLSQQDFFGDDIVDCVQGILDKYDLPSSLFHVEVTETIFATDPTKVGNYIKRFRKQGFQVWMDDFGSGYSSLNMLKDYQFDCLKLDMLFMKGFEEKHETRVILQSIINMAKNLGIQTVAEGVESKKAADYLKKIGCENIQGFLYSVPLSIDDCLKSPVKRESSGMRKYFTKIGKVNLFSLNPLDISDDSMEKEGMPMAILELRGDKIVYLSCNPAYMKHLDSVGFDSLEMAQEYVNSGAEKLPSIFLNALKRNISAENHEPVDYVLNGQSCSFIVRHITTYRNRSAFLLSSINVSAYKQAVRSEKQQAMLSFIYTQFNRIDLMDPTNMTIDNIYINSSEYSYYKSIKDSVKFKDYFANNFVHEKDRDRFITYVEKSTLVERINNTKKDYITDYFRIKGLNDKYRWQEFSIISARVNDKLFFLICIGNLDIDRVRMLQGMDDKVKGIPRNPAFMWLTSREFSKILGYRSYSDFLDSSFYYEANITQDIFLDIHMADDSVIKKELFKEGLSYTSIIQNFINNHTDIQDVEAASKFYDRNNIIKEYEAGNEVGNLEYRSYAKGKMVWLHSLYQVIKSEETGELFAYFLTYDVDEYNRKLMKEKKAQETDFLTGLPNRYSAVPKIRDYIFRNPECTSAIVMIDLDDFKNINDKYGHICGDEMLKAVAEKLKNSFELYGIVCRLGGDEFLGLLADKSKDFADEFLEKLLAQPVTIDYNGQKVSCNMSAGYSMFPEHGKGYHELYEKADKAMYASKHGGKNRFNIYTAGEEEIKISQIELTTQELLETMPGAFAICEYDDKISFLLMNGNFTSYFKCRSAANLHSIYGGSFLNIISDEDRKMVADAINNGFDNYSGQIIKMSLNFVDSTGDIKKAMCHIRFKKSRGGDRLHIMIT